VTSKAFSVRREADADFDRVLDYYLVEAGDVVAMRFIAAVREAHRLIAETPQIGSPRLGDQLQTSGLRSLRTHGFPYLVIYLEEAGEVEIWRLLHAQRDLESELDSTDG